MKKTKCEDCEGLGYFTDVDAIGINDPKDPYYYPHTERCDRCLVFSSDKEADDFLKRGNNNVQSNNRKQVPRKSNKFKQSSKAVV